MKPASPLKPRRTAEDALLDHAVLSVSLEAYTAFLERLDARPYPNQRLRETPHTPLPWNRD